MLINIFIIYTKGIFDNSNIVLWYKIKYNNNNEYIGSKNEITD